MPLPSPTPEHPVLDGSTVRRLVDLPTLTEPNRPQIVGRLGVAKHEKGDILPLLGTPLILTSVYIVGELTNVRQISGLSAQRVAPGMNGCPSRRSCIDYELKSVFAADFLNMLTKIITPHVATGN